jgi:hypothetical protein
LQNSICASTVLSDPCDPCSSVVRFLKFRQFLAVLAILAIFVSPSPTWHSTPFQPTRTPCHPTLPQACRLRHPASPHRAPPLSPLLASRRVLGIVRPVGFVFTWSRRSSCFLRVSAVKRFLFPGDFGHHGNFFTTPLLTADRSQPQNGKTRPQSRVSGFFCSGRIPNEIRNHPSMISLRCNKKISSGA